MLKKIVLGVILLLVLLTAFSPVNAAEMTLEVEKPADYYLAYPGLLPDHFLYPIKMLRDKILLFLTTDVMKKAELYLLFADKRIGAAKSLIEGGKEKLGVRTAQEAEEYLAKAVQQEELAREKNQETHTFLEKLENASQKHNEVMLQIQKKVTEQAREQIQTALQATEQSQEQIRQRRGQ